MPAAAKGRARMRRNGGTAHMGGSPSGSPSAGCRACGRLALERLLMATKSLERMGLLVRRDLTLGTLMDRLEKVHGDRRLVTESDGGLDLTYAQAAKRVRRWSAGIAAKTTPGDVVVIATANGYEQLLLCIAAA